MSGSFPTLPIFTWGNRPPANAVPMGTAIRISDVGVAPGIIVVSDGVNWVPQGMQLLARSGLAASITGTTAESILATITVPGGLLGPNGGLLVYSSWSYTNSANTKTLRLRFGGIGGAQYLSTGQTTTASLFDIRKIRNRNNAASQVGSVGSNGIVGASSVGIASSNLDTTAAQDIVLTAQLGLGTESTTLENYDVWATA